ncbi:MAG: hypothetical protein WBP08_08820 [Saprospiraceae bacterium]|jgi:hypothetical protein
METKEMDESERFYIRIAKHVMLFVKNNKLFTILFISLIAYIVWTKLELNSQNKKYEKQTSEIINTYELKIDSLSISKMELTARVFSWAVRSEMVRDNIESVNQLFLTFIKEKGISKLQLINPDTGLIMVASDKKDEGQLSPDSRIIEANELITIPDSLSFKIITPIMGLNKKMGILVLDLKK